MNINMDEAIKANRSRFREETKNSSSKLLLIIMIGVFLGTTASTLTIRAMDNLILRVQLSVLNKQMAADKARLDSKLEQQRKINAANAKQNQIENEKKQAGLRQAMETCNFWRREYAKESSNYNKLQRDQSCSFVNEFR